ncbi:MAG: GNAT family N-acetyltransferase [Marinosulfonomonas sp.]|nr:GNAT family N-acetyltransferase [Marinosulfonomonas sp.]
MEISWDQCGQAGWDYLSNLARAPMQQRWDYGATHAALGGQVHRAVIYQNGDPVALCQSICRKFAGLLNTSLATRGPLWLAPCDHARVLALIRRTSPMPHPRVQLFTTSDPALRLIPMMTPTTNAQLTLPVTMEILHGKWRNSLKKAQNSGLRTRHITCPTKALLSLLEVDHKQQGAKSYRALPAAFTLKWHRKNPAALRLITVSTSGSISGGTIATALLILHGNTATYHISHTTDAGRKLSAGRLALWRAFNDFTAQGVRQIDLGQIDTVNASGLARFKLGTGARAQMNGATVLAI